MQIDPNLIYNFSQQPQTLLTNIGQGAAQLGGNIVGLIQQKRANEAEAQRQADYTKLLTQFHETGDTSLISQMQQIAPEKFEEFKQAYDMMDEIGRKATVQNSMETLGFLSSGNTEKASERLATASRAYRQAGNDAQAERYQDLSNAVLEGRTNDVASYLKLAVSASTEGQAAIESFNAINKDVREEGEFALNIMKAGQELNLPQEDLDTMQVAADNDPEFGETIGTALNYAIAVEQGYEGTQAEFDKIVTDLNGDFFQRTEGLRNSGVAQQNITTAVDKALAATDDGSRGILDLEALQLFQRQIDDATVRKDDVENIKDTNDFIGQIGLFVQRAKDGSLLTDDQRRAMKQVSEDLHAAQKAYVDDVVYPSLRTTQMRVKDDDTTYKEVFGNYIGPDREGYAQTSKEGEASSGGIAEPVPKELIDARAFITEEAKKGLSSGTWTQDEIDAIQNMSLDELKLFTNAWGKYEESLKPNVVKPNPGIYGGG